MNTSPTISVKIVLPAFLFPKCTADPNLLLQLLGDEQRLSIQNFVVDNLSDKDGGPEITDLRVQQFRYDESTCHGSFRVHFQIKRRYCCSDVTACQNDYLDFEFEYLNEELTATATYFQWNLDN